MFQKMNADRAVKFALGNQMSLNEAASQVVVFCSGLDGVF